jgi:hypothetical protein
MDDIRSQGAHAEQSLQPDLASLIAHLERRFPMSISGFYLFGSQSDRTAVDASDVDLCIVVSSDIDPALIKQEYDDFASGGRLNVFDVLVLSQQSLIANGHFRIKHCSQHIHGTDIRDSILDLPFDTYLRTYAHAPIAYLVGVLRESECVTFPVTYPDPIGEFLGYNKPAMPPGNQQVNNIKAMVSTASWIASILVSLQTGRTVASKAEAVTLFRTQVGDEWSRYVEELYRFGRQQLGYLVPGREDERQYLLQLCRDMVDLENHFLVQYREYLLREIGRDHGTGRRTAIERLTEVIYGDEVVMGKLAMIADEGDEELRNLALVALQAIERESAH